MFPKMTRQNEGRKDTRNQTLILVPCFMSCVENMDSVTTGVRTKIKVFLNLGVLDLFGDL